MYSIQPPSPPSPPSPPPLPPRPPPVFEDRRKLLAHEDLTEGPSASPTVAPHGERDFSGLRPGFNVVVVRAAVAGSSCQAQYMVAVRVAAPAEQLELLALRVQGEDAQALPLHPPFARSVTQYTVHVAAGAQALSFGAQLHSPGSSSLSFRHNSYFIPAAVSEELYNRTNVNGANEPTMTFEVTAADGISTRSYAVTVTLPPPPPPPPPPAPR
jgi:hypothetical protein